MEADNISFSSSLTDEQKQGTIRRTASNVLNSFWSLTKTIVEPLPEPEFPLQRSKSSPELADKKTQSRLEAINGSEAVNISWDGNQGGSFVFDGNGGDNFLQPLPDMNSKAHEAPGYGYMEISSPLELKNVSREKLGHKGDSELDRSGSLLGRDIKRYFFYTSVGTQTAEQKATERQIQTESVEMMSKSSQIQPQSQHKATQVNKKRKWKTLWLTKAIKVD